MISKVLHYSIIFSLLLPIKSMANNYEDINGKWSTYYEVSDFLNRNEEFILNADKSGSVNGTVVETEIGSNPLPPITRQLTGRFVDKDNIVLQNFRNGQLIFTYKFKILDRNKFEYKHPWRDFPLILTKSSGSANISTVGNKKKSNISLGQCVEQNFSMRSDNKFTLKNTCDYAINVKYIFSISKPFHGTYTTLRPNETTLEMGSENEKVSYYMCPAPKIPQSLKGLCI